MSMVAELPHIQRVYPNNYPKIVSSNSQENYSYRFQGPKVFLFKKYWQTWKYLPQIFLSHFVTICHIFSKFLNCHILSHVKMLNHHLLTHIKMPFLKMPP